MNGEDAVDLGQVPFKTRTRSPCLAISIADCIVVYSLETNKSAPLAAGEKERKAARIAVLAH